MTRSFEIFRDFGEEYNNTEQRDLFEILGNIRAGDRVTLFDQSSRAREWIALSAGEISISKRTFGLWVKGWSAVESSINDGDLVILQQQYHIEPGDLVAAFLKSDESALLKKIYWDDKYVRLASANATIPPLLIDDPNDVQIQGKVVGVVPYERFKRNGRMGRLIII